MKRYVIERNIPGAGRLTPEELQKIASKSVDVLDSMEEGIQWNESFVTGDKLFCVYLADDEDVLREHGRRGGFPVDGIYEVSRMFDPTTATAALVAR